LPAIRSKLHRIGLSRATLGWDIAQACDRATPRLRPTTLLPANLENPEMRRRPFNPTPLAVALQTASLAVIAGALFGILIGDIASHRAKVVSVETKSQAQPFALPHEGDADPDN